jgi:beta-mannosidase
VVRTRAGFKITLSSDKLARAVYLSMPNYPGSFSDNYFDMIPGTKVEVEFHTGRPVTVTDFQRRLKIRSMADAF